MWASVLLMEQVCFIRYMYRRLREQRHRLGSISFSMIASDKTQGWYECMMNPLIDTGITRFHLLLASFLKNW